MQLVLCFQVQILFQIKLNILHNIADQHPKSLEKSVKQALIQ